MVWGPRGLTPCLGGSLPAGMYARTKEGKEENSPTPPIRRNPKKQTTTTKRARARLEKILENFLAEKRLNLGLDYRGA